MNKDIVVKPLGNNLFHQFTSALEKANGAIGLG